MKAVYNLLLTIFFIVLIPTCIVFAQEDQKKSEVFDLGDVLVLEKSGDVSKVTTTNIISIEDIEQTGASNVAEALEQITGIDIVNHPKAGPTLKMRGFDQEDVKILIDGVPAHTAYDGFLDLGQISVDTIAKIEVTKGASSVLYGANTMGGVINIITKKGGKDFFTKVTTSFGKHGTQNHILNHGGAKGKFNYWLTYSSRKSDGYEVSDNFDPSNPVSGVGTEYNEDGGVRDLSYYDNQTLNTKIGYEFDTNSRLYLSFDYHDNERGCPTFGDRFGNRYWEFDQWNQWHLNLVGEHDVTNNVMIKGRLFYVDHEDSLTDISWDAAHTTGRKWFEKSSYDDYSQGGDFQAYITLSDNNLLKLGTTYIKDHHTQQDYYDATCFPVTAWGESIGYQPIETYEAITYSFSIEDELMLFNDKLTLIGGMSYDVYSPEEAHDQPVPDKIKSLNPQIGMLYQIDDSLNLHASVGKKTRFPQLKELYSTMAGGNSNLKPQEAIAYEIGMSNKFNNDLSMSLAVFYNDIENKIVQERNTAGDRVYVNKGESAVKGLEAEIDYTTGFNLKVGANYTYLVSKDRADSFSRALDSEYIPTHKYTFDFRYMFDFGLSASLQWIYTGGQIEYDNAGDKNRIDNFTIYNARFVQKLTMFDKITPELFLEIENITDKNYEEGDGPTAGRSFLLGASITF